MEKKTVLCSFGGSFGVAASLPFARAIRKGKKKREYQRGGLKTTKLRESQNYISRQTKQSTFTQTNNHA